MRQNEENVTAMFEATLLFLDTHNNTWSAVPALVECVNQANQNVQSIRKMASTQETATTGVSDEKIQHRDELEDLALDVAHALTAFATRTNNSSLSANARFGRRSLDRLQDDDMVQTSQHLYDLANANAEQLQSFGITAEKIAALKEATTKFDQARKTTRAASIGRTSATGSLAELIRATRSIFRNEIDKLITPFRNTAPEFYRGYIAARVIIDRTATHASAKAPMPQIHSAMPAVNSPATASAK